ncbi:MAG: DeoR/GlpR family DNA-binding transcription regulator [Kineothrix sp.]|nr:DeoR/GlpR family DNA-binding transcription regulator [Kineothrix sp.]
MKSSKNAIAERRNDLIRILSRKENASVSEMTSELHVSEITVRRDLNFLESKGIILRYFGGARLLRNETDILQSQDMDPVSLKKNIIAKYMAALISDNDTIFINSSSTAYMIYPYVTAKNVTYITNNAKSILQKRSPDSTLILTGGEVFANKSSLTGAYALDIIDKVTCTKCIIGVSGISMKGGITSSILPETIINRAMIEHCKGPVYVLADRSKIGIVHNFYSAPLSDINYLVTDRDAEEESLLQLRQAGLHIFIADN